MEDSLIEILSTFGYPVIRQGSLATNEDYPDNFFTFWNNTSYDHHHYDNRAANNIEDYDVNFYSNDPQKLYDTHRAAIDLLKTNGWIISGNGYDVASDVETHTGRGVNALFMKRNNIN